MRTLKEHTTLSDRLHGGGGVGAICTMLAASTFKVELELACSQGICAGINWDALKIQIINQDHNHVGQRLCGDHPKTEEQRMRAMHPAGTGGRALTENAAS